LKALITGSSSAADYFKDERFLILPEVFESAYQNLEEEIEKFQKLTAAWSKLKINLKMGV